MGQILLQLYENLLNDDDQRIRLQLYDVQFNEYSTCIRRVGNFPVAIRYKCFAFFRFQKMIKFYLLISRVDIYLKRRILISKALLALTFAELNIRFSKK